VHTELNLFVSEACTLRARFPGTAGDDTGALLGTHKPIDLQKQACQEKYLNMNDVSLYDISSGRTSTWKLTPEAEAISVGKRPTTPISLSRTGVNGFV
jgi:hypothetical protein